MNSSFHKSIQPDPEKLRGYIEWALSLSDEEFSEYVQERKRKFEEEIKRLLSPIKASYK